MAVPTPPPPIYKTAPGLCLSVIKTDCMPAKNDLRAAVGQLLIMGFDGIEAATRLKTSISTLQPGGIILFARNILDPRQTHSLLRDCQKLVPTPLFRCVDMEGGTVDRLKAVIAPAPSAAEVFAAGDKKLFRAHGRVIGDAVRALGFNTDFAPVLDLDLPASRAVLTSRTVSPDPLGIVAYASQFLAGLREAGVLGCGKHFPGLGEASLDSHHQLPVIHKPWMRLWSEDLLPYRQLHRQLPYVMVAHAAFPEVTGDGQPASLSEKWIEEILRKQIGYRGLVISDDLEMAGALATGSIDEAAVRTIAAGADLFLVCRKEENVWSCYQRVLREAERDRAFAGKVTQAARRVLAFKRKSRSLLQLRAAPPSARVVDALRKALESLSEKTARPQPAASHPPLATAAP